MSQFLQFLVLGLGTGAVYAALGTGLVVTFKGTGVINFAVAVMAAVGAHVFDELDRNGSLHLPLFPEVHVGDLPTIVSLLVAAVVAGVLGLLVHVLIFARLRTAPPLAKVVASVGVMITLQAVLAIDYGTQGRPRRALLGSGTSEVFGATIPDERLWATALIIIGGAALAMWFRLSMTGLAVRAAAENERFASLARLSPTRLSRLTWVLSTVFTTVALILAGTITPVLGPFTWTLLVVPALAAALVGRFTSIGGAIIAGLALGAGQASLQYFSITRSWWPEWAKVGLTDAVPFIVIVVSLFVVGQSIPLRGSVTEGALPPVFLPKNRPLVVIGWVAVGAVLVTVLSGSYRFGLITSFAFMLISLSLVLLTGMVGQISLAQAAFAGTAGFMLAKIGGDIPFPFGMIISALMAAVVGVAVGIPATRIRGIQLAVVTLAAAVTIERFVFGNPSILDPLTEAIPAPTLFRIDLGIRSGRDIARVEFGLMALAMVAIAFVLTGNVMRGRTGRRFLAVRSNERAAAGIGIAPSSTKLLAFAIAAFLAGLGGALIGYSRGQLSPASFGVIVGLTALAVAYLGGITSLSGAVVGGMLAPLGLFFVFLDRTFDLSQNRAIYYTLFSGLSLILTTILNPIGIAGKTRADIRRFLDRGRDADREPHTWLVSDPPPPPEHTLGPVAFAAHNITVTFGGLRAVDDVSLEIRAGEIVGLIGPNGAGKTTFIDAVTGFVPSRGHVTLSNDDISTRSPYERARAGLARTWQSVELFDDLSARENVLVAAQPTTATTAIIDMVAPNRGNDDERVDAALALVGLGDVGDRRPTELTLGQQKLLGVARALAAHPTLLLLDEPAAGLSTQETETFGTYLRHVAATDVACLLVDHDMSLVLAVCHRVYVIDFGRVIVQGTPTEVRHHPAVITAYLGGSLDDTEAETTSESGAEE